MLHQPMYSHDEILHLCNTIRYGKVQIGALKISMPVFMHFLQKVILSENIGWNSGHGGNAAFSLVKHGAHLVAVNVCKLFFFYCSIK